MLEIKDLALSYLEGYIHAKVTEHLRKQSLRAVLRTLIKMYTFAPNFKFGTK